MHKGDGDVFDSSMYENAIADDDFDKEDDRLLFEWLGVVDGVSSNQHQASESSIRNGASHKPSTSDMIYTKLEYDNLTSRSNSERSYTISGINDNEETIVRHHSHHHQHQSSRLAPILVSTKVRDHLHTVSDQNLQYRHNLHLPLSTQVAEHSTMPYREAIPPSNATADNLPSPNLVKSPLSFASSPRLFEQHQMQAHGSMSFAERSQASIFSLNHLQQQSQIVQREEQQLERRGQGPQHQGALQQGQPFFPGSLSLNQHEEVQQKLFETGQQRNQSVESGQLHQTHQIMRRIEQQREDEQRNSGRVRVGTGKRRLSSSQSRSKRSKRSSDLSESGLKKVASGDDLSEGKGPRGPTSLEIFESYVKHTRDEQGNRVVDTSEVISRDCYEQWVSSRKTKPRIPEEAFRKALVSYITVADGASKPFEPEVEKSLLDLLRKREVWPCFKDRCHEGTDKKILIGSNGIRAKGYHEGRQHGVVDADDKTLSGENPIRRAIVNRPEGRERGRRRVENRQHKVTDGIQMEEPTLFQMENRPHLQHSHQPQQVQSLHLGHRQMQQFNSHPAAVAAAAATADPNGILFPTTQFFTPNPAIFQSPPGTPHVYSMSRAQRGTTGVIPTALYGQQASNNTAQQYAQQHVTQSQQTVPQLLNYNNRSSSDHLSSHPAAPRR